jgi:hypothetical protein
MTWSHNDIFIPVKIHLTNWTHFIWRDFKLTILIVFEKMKFEKKRNPQIDFELKLEEIESKTKLNF